MAVWKKSWFYDASSSVHVEIQLQSLICRHENALEESSALLNHVCRRLLVPSEVVCEGEEGLRLYHKGKNIRELQRKSFSLKLS